MPAADVLIVSLGSTAGLRAADDELAGALRRAGATVAVVTARPPREVRTLRADRPRLGRAARRAARAAIAEHRPARHRLLDDHRGAAVAAARRDPLRRPGGGEPARPPRRLAAPARAPALGAGAAARPRRRRHARRDAAPARAGDRRADPGRAVRPASPARATSPPSPTPPTRTRRASTACSRPGRPRGATARSSSSRARTCASTRPACASRAASTPADYRALLRRARVYACAPRREDYGIAQLEALADGCVLVTTTAPGPYAALPLARALDPRLVVGDDAPSPPRCAPRSTTRSRATPRARRTRSRRSRDASVDVIVGEQLLPRLLAGSSRRGRRARMSAPRSRALEPIAHTGAAGAG